MPYVRRKYEIDWLCKLLTINNNNSSQFFVFSTRDQTQDLCGLGQRSIIELHTKSGFAEKRKGLTTQRGLECIMQFILALHLGLLWDAFVSCCVSISFESNHYPQKEEGVFLRLRKWTQLTSFRKLLKLARFTQLLPKVMWAVPVLGRKLWSTGLYWVVQGEPKILTEWVTTHERVSFSVILLPLSYSCSSK